MNFSFDTKKINQTAQLLETRIKLTGNYMLCVKDHEIKFTRLNDTPNSYKFKDIIISDIGNLSWDLKKFLTQDTYFEHAYEKINFFDKPYKEDPIQQIDTSELSGVKKISGNNITYFAPLWVADKIPQKFIIYRIAGAADISAKMANGIKLSNFIDKELIEKASIVKVFDLTNLSKIGKYLRKYIEDATFPKHPIELVKEEEPYIAFHGISLTTLGFVKKIDRERLLNRSRPLRVFDEILADKFKENRIVSANIINLGFNFIDEYAEDFKFYRYFGIYVDETISNIELQANPYHFHEYDKFGQLITKNTNINLIPITESPKYFQNQVNINTHTGEATGLNYFGFIKTSNEKYYSYDSTFVVNAPNLEDLSITNLDKFLYLRTTNNIQLNDFFKYKRAKLDLTYEFLTANEKLFTGDDENSFIAIPNRGPAEDPKQQPVIKKVFTNHLIKIEPGSLGQLYNNLSEYTVVISKPFYYGHFHPYPLRRFESSLFAENDGNFEQSYAYLSNVESKDGKYASINAYFDQDEQYLLQNVSSQATWNYVNFPLKPPSIRWRSSEGSDARNNAILLTNSLWKQDYHVSPSSVIYNEKERQYTQDTNIRNVKRYSHEWLFLNGEISESNICFTLNHITPQRGDVFTLSLPTDINHPINYVKLMYTGHKIQSGIHIGDAFVRIDNQSVSISNAQIISTLQMHSNTILFNNKYKIVPQFHIFLAEPSAKQIAENILTLPKPISTLTSDSVFFDTSVDNFKQIFENTIIERNGIYFTPSSNLTYVYFDNGNIWRESSTWFKGIQVCVSQRSGFKTIEARPLNTLTQLVNNGFYNNYRFATILVLDNMINTGDYRVKVIENRKFKYIVLTLQLNENEFSGICTYKDMYTNIKWAKYSFSWIKNLLGRYEIDKNQLIRNDVQVSFISVLEDNSIIYDNFYVWFKESTLYTKDIEYVIKPFNNKNIWPKALQKTFGSVYSEIGHQVERIRPVTREGRISGKYFMPSLEDTWVFTRSSKTAPSVFLPPPYLTDMFKLKNQPFIKFGRKEHFLLANTSPVKREVEIFQGSTFKNKVIKKIRRINNKEIKYFPKIGESPIGYKDLFIFDNNWDIEFMSRYLHVSNGQPNQENISRKLPGYIIPTEVTTPFGTKILKLPNSLLIHPIKKIPLSLTRFRTLQTSINPNELLSDFLTQKNTIQELSTFVNEEIITLFYKDKNTFIHDFISENIVTRYKLDKIIMFLANDVSPTPVILDHTYISPEINLFTPIKDVNLSNTEIQNVVKQEVAVSTTQNKNYIKLDIHLGAIEEEANTVSNSTTEIVQYQIPGQRQFIETVNRRFMNQIISNEQLIEKINRSDKFTFYMFMQYLLK